MTGWLCGYTGIQLSAAACILAVIEVGVGFEPTHGEFCRARLTGAKESR